MLSLCIDKEMVAGKRQAMDSVYVQANASMESLQRKEVLKDVDNYTDELNDEEQTFLAEEKKEIQNNKAAKENLLSVASSGQKPVCSDNQCNKSLSNHTLQSTTDKDARISVKPGKARRLNYLAQVSVDTANHVITHIQSDFADKKDSQCLPSLVHNTINNLSENGLQVEEVLADGNYSSSEALRVLEHENIEGYIPNFGQYKSSRKGFEYDKEKDCYICPQGKVLEYKSTRSHKNGAMKQYRSSRKDCSECPLKSQCINKGSLKTIAVTVDKELFERMHHRLQTPTADV